MDSKSRTIRYEKYWPTIEIRKPVSEKYTYLLINYHEIEYTLQFDTQITKLRPKIYGDETLEWKVLIYKWSVVVQFYIKLIIS